MKRLQYGVMGERAGGREQGTGSIAGKDGHGREGLWFRREGGSGRPSSRCRWLGGGQHFG